MRIKNVKIDDFKYANELKCGQRVSALSGRTVFSTAGGLIYEDTGEFAPSSTKFRCDSRVDFSELSLGKCFRQHTMSFIKVNICQGVRLSTGHIVDIQGPVTPIKEVTLED